MTRAAQPKSRKLPWTQPCTDALPTFSRQRIAANTFTLENRRICVSFSATSITGQPLVHYKDRQHEVNARGDEIRLEETESARW